MFVLLQQSQLRFSRQGQKTLPVTYPFQQRHDLCQLIVFAGNMGRCATPILPPKLSNPDPIAPYKLSNPDPIAPYDCFSRYRFSYCLHFSENLVFFLRGMQTMSFLAASSCSGKCCETNIVGWAPFDSSSLRNGTSSSLNSTTRFRYCAPHSLLVANRCPSQTLSKTARIPPTEIFQSITSVAYGL